jgi:FKBP12-rapamycin complex-associated protein
MIHEGFLRGTAESVHGSLLVAREMLTHTGDFMIPRFKEICKAIMALKDHRSRVVRAAIAALLPELATFCPDAFARTHLDESVELLVKCSAASDLRPQALLSTGKLCRAVGSYLVDRVDEMVAIVQEALAKKNRNARGDVPQEALQCVSDMVLGLGEPFHEKVVTLLEPMLQGGLTGELINTLTVIATHMPYQRPVQLNFTFIIISHCYPLLELFSFARS